jgi:hypothetical protein
MTQTVEKQERKNEWGLVEAKPKAVVHWKESPEYVRTAAFVQNAYGPFGKIVFTGLGVVALVALGIWGLSFIVAGLEGLILSIRDLTRASSVGGGVSSVAGSLFYAVWSCAVAAVILFPIWHGLRYCYGRFLILTSHPGQNDNPVIDLTEKR